eukprot:CAMPEP_0175762930 /NCGR_PEP_ID=MMETSP0097-20121207/67467_1 /TAXON_ID=311494 /ORGANISM="Alexandrium monilatum, Strain CCMP3105" /LENGTH=57 /DNA_ID=CAMNT_0017072627 /DNA_START=58 /DNA_END=228 /DNA_ORIENTATION=-
MRPGHTFHACGTERDRCRRALPSARPEGAWQLPPLLPAAERRAGGRAGCPSKPAGHA